MTEDCPREDCDGWLNPFIAPVGYDYGCTECLTKYSKNFDDKPHTETKNEYGPTWEDVEELEEANEKLRKIAVWLAQGVLVLSLVVLVLVIAL